MSRKKQFPANCHQILAELDAPPPAGYIPAMTETKDQKAARLAAALRANLRRRKGQQRGRDDLSGRDPNRKDTLLQQAPAPYTPTQETPAQNSGDASASSPSACPDPASPVTDDKQT